MLDRGAPVLESLVVSWMWIVKVEWPLRETKVGDHCVRWYKLVPYKMVNARKMTQLNEISIALVCTKNAQKFIINLIIHKSFFILSPSLHALSLTYEYLLHLPCYNLKYKTATE